MVCPITYGDHNNTVLFSAQQDNNRRCLLVCLSLATLRKKTPNGLHEIWRSGSQIQIRSRIHIATLVRRALAEVCTVAVHASSLI